MSRLALRVAGDRCPALRRTAWQKGGADRHGAAWGTGAAGPLRCGREVTCARVPSRLGSSKSPRDCPLSRAQGLRPMKAWTCRRPSAGPGALWLWPGGFKMHWQLTILPFMQKRKQVVLGLSGLTGVPRAERPHLHTHLAIRPGTRPRDKTHELSLCQNCPNYLNKWIDLIHNLKWEDKCKNIVELLYKTYVNVFDIYIFSELHCKYICHICMLYKSSHQLVVHGTLVVREVWKVGDRRSTIYCVCYILIINLINDTNKEKNNSFEMTYLF